MKNIDIIIKKLKFKKLIKPKIRVLRVGGFYDKV
jgi:hypothetical protein